MKKVLVLGSGGSGKTTFAAKLSQKTGLPLYHLDALYWKPGWVEPPAAEWQKRIAALVEKDAWIIDGSYGGTLELRIPKADTILFLDMPNWLCVWNILKRRIKFARVFGRTRPGMAPECPETIHFSFLMWVWSYPKSKKPNVLAMINRLKQTETQVVIFKSYSALDKFLLRSRIEGIAIMSNECSC